MCLPCFSLSFSFLVGLFSFYTKEKSRDLKIIVQSREGKFDIFEGDIALMVKDGVFSVLSGVEQENIYIYIDKLKETLEECKLPYRCEKIEPHGTITFAVPRE